MTLLDQLNPLKPYLTLIKWCVSLLLAASLFIGGCVRGENNGEESRVSLAGQVTALTEANKKWASTAAEAERQQKANQQFAKEKQAEVDAVAKDISKLRKEQEKKNQKWQAQLAEAQKDPTCADVLKLKLCPAIPLP